ncbi:ABC transporter permease [Paenibacillus agaridevorans]|uniref:ABC transporter permease n=1 Tax=Paenibacillus agaridevorans TaxID=171404 RepID=UPI001BE4DAA1|nr:ABC transporter permease subunit [Paenibacillus agaridevorans]
MNKLYRQKWLIAFALPGFLFFLVFSYFPMYGIVISFQDFDVFKGVFRSDFVGFDNFNTLFDMPDFNNALRNTILISALKLILLFPATVVFALLINEISTGWFRKFVQTTSYLPYFVSWVIAAGIWYKLLSIDGGVVNDLLVSLGILKEPFHFMADKDAFYPIILFTEAWKNMGFSAIIFIASLSAIDVQQYEAAKMDGANRFRQIWHISLPGIKNTIVLMFILNASNLLKAGQDQMWTMSNVTVQQQAEILDTLVLRYLKDMGLMGYSIGTAMGIFQAFIGLALFIVCNYLAKAAKSDSII